MNQEDETSRDPIRELECSEPRPQMPQDAFLQVKAAARKQWLEVVRQESQSAADSPSPEPVPAAASGEHDEPHAGSQRMPLLAFAAALLLSVAVALWFGKQDADAPAPLLAVAATLERVVGEAQIEAPSSADFEPASVGGEVEAGSAIVTEGSSMMALRLATGASLRLAPNTRVLILDAQRVEIESGRLYFDSAGAQTSEEGSVLLEVLAGGAVIRDIGTQFEVRRDSGLVQLRVREGVGQLRLGSRQANAGAGEQLTAAANGAESATEPLIERAEFESTIDVWRWALEIAPSFSLDGATLGQYLEWVARETGWQIDTTSPDVVQLLDKQTCCVETQLPPNQPEEVLSTLGLTSQLRGNVLVVSVR